MRDLFVEGLHALSATETERLRRDVEAYSRSVKFFYRRIPGKPSILHPVAVNPAVFRISCLPKLRSLARAVFRFHLRLPELTRENYPGLDAVCGLEPRARQWLELCPDRARPQDLLIRIDVGFDRGSPILYETNATAVAGFYYHTQAVGLIKSFVFSRFGSHGLKHSPNLLNFLHHWIRRAAPGRTKIGFVEEPPFEPGDTEMPQVALYLRQKGLKACWGTPQGLRKGRMGFFLGGQSVDWLYRDTPFKEMPSVRSADLEPFREMLAECRVAPGPAAEFDHKGMLECFTSAEFLSLFTRYEADLFRSTVPWTRVIYPRKTSGPEGKPIDLLESLRQSPERWLIKPNRDCGGAGVIWGGKDPRKWEEALERAVRQNGKWVAQKWQPTDRRPMFILNSGKFEWADCHATLGVYYGGRELGFYSRVNPSPVVNIARGGAVAGVFFA